MKRTIIAIPLPPKDTFTLKIKAPGIIRTAAMAYTQESGGIITDKGQPRLKETPVIFVEIDPDGEEAEREFRVAPENQVIESQEETIEYRGHLISQANNGTVFHLFELVANA